MFGGGRITLHERIGSSNCSSAKHTGARGE